MADNGNNKQNYFELFCQEIDDTLKSVKELNEQREQDINQTMKNLDAEDESFEQRMNCEKRRLNIEKSSLEKDLAHIKVLDNLLSIKLSDWEKQLYNASEQLKEILADENSRDDHMKLQNLSASLLESLSQLSMESMSNQFTELNNELQILRNQKTELQNRLSKQEQEIADLSYKLRNTYGLTYKEIIGLKFTIKHQKSVLRKEYQNYRLIEQSLKTKLAMS